MVLCVPLDDDIKQRPHQSLESRSIFAVENNIVIGTGQERSAAFVLAPAGVGVHNVAVRNNTVYNWTRCLSWVGVPGEKLEKPRQVCC